MNRIQGILTTYKRTIAGSYRSLAPDLIERELPPGACTVSEKIDGETWFLQSDGKHCLLLSPFGKSLINVAITNEAEKMLEGWQGILAGELYASVETGRSHVFDLHAVLVANADTQNKRLRFAVFDILQDGKQNLQQKPFAKRLEYLQALLSKQSDYGKHLHLARFETAESASDVTACYQQIVTAGGAEGIVVHAADDRIYKIKPEINIDAAVVAYAVSKSGVSELLMALLKPVSIAIADLPWHPRKVKGFASRQAAW